MRKQRLEGKVAIVTGASSGIGRATAVAMAREGARVVAVGRRGGELDATVRLAEEAGGEAIACVADVTDEAQVEATVARAMARYGRVDVGVNAAGGTFAGALTHELDASAFRDWLDGHLVSAFLCTKHQIRAMLASGGGSIVQIGTFVGDTKAFPGTAGYAAAKTGLLGLTRTVAAEYATRGVRANVLSLGGVDTPMFRLWNDDAAKREGAAQLHAMKRVALPEEIANAAIFLASDEASFVTGGVVAVDGGVALT